MAAKQAKSKKHGGRIGGFAGQNSGEISDCYSIVRLNTPRDITGGFVGENIGEVASSFYSGPIRQMIGGVSCAGKSKPEQTYFFHTEKEGGKKLGELRDKPLGIHVDTLRDMGEKEALKYLAGLGYDVEEIWEYIAGTQVMRFIPEKWLLDITKTALNPQIEVIKIRTADELFELAENINEGDKKLAGAYIRLENDIDLGGKAWTPIGTELAKAFTGMFDGSGHKITSFKIKDKSLKAKGFFGYLKGAVMNLTVDCAICGKDGAAGGIAAYCEGGVIGYCAALVDMKCGEGKFGGLVGVNTGNIYQSYAAGKISRIVIPWWWGLPLLPFALTLLLLLQTVSPPEDDLPIFAPPPVDPGTVRIPDPVESRTGRNFVSFEFEREIQITLATGQCLFNFRNPGSSNHAIVVQLQMTDAEAIKAMGSTGRTAEEQAALERRQGYDPENHRMILAESGAIPVGYRLDNLTLSEQPNGATLPPGEYPAIVFLIFYDKDSHSRAMLESQLPVVIRVG